MRYTNNLNFPQAIVEAVQAHQYDGGGADIGVTTLIDSPRPKFLRNSHEDELVEDVSENIWALMGNSIHQMLEMVESNVLTEERFLYGYKLLPTLARHLGKDVLFIGLKPDRLALIEKRLDDYKMASVWEVMLGIKQSRIWQLALYQYMLRKLGFEVETCRIIYILRDWQMSKCGDAGCR